jgi:hypothetical protein
LHGLNSGLEERAEDDSKSGGDKEQAYNHEDAGGIAFERAAIAAVYMIQKGYTETPQERCNNKREQPKIEQDGKNTCFKL